MQNNLAALKHYLVWHYHPELEYSPWDIGMLSGQYDPYLQGHSSLPTIHILFVKMSAHAISGKLAIALQDI